ncbi:metal ABC transporter permease [Parapusillimonas granuli]|uniref:Metal ABC transporter permease n=1 Tax=Parapusillimonas granuli TaxID=380911 RepID=A0A853G0P6_9BURK|nr:metal ABC transporter permease [Parapusillimonas granuli]MBB5214012.1 manganese/iron transport system permease protein [Parapusillimonas granuli]MEB2400863.1 metal ABC transporter permease [Alcaligenaceae bacterium]NYT50433.1 metal ABC transporter permease [Parapusillimonas granuli]
MSTLELLLAPLQFDFMWQALLISALVALPTALLSCLLVLKGWALMGDAVSHAVLPGVVLAYMAGLPVGVGAVAAGMACAIGAGYIQANSRLKQDTVMGVVFSGMFGLGVVLHTGIRSDVHLDHILFGDMLGVGWGDLAESAAIALVVAGTVAVKWRDLLLHAFDPVQARTVGLRVNLLHYGLLAMLSLTIVGALKAVGIILVIALLIAPGAMAFLLTRSFGAMLPAAAAISLGACLSGVYLSFFLDSAPAPTVVVVLSAMFMAVLARSLWRGRKARKAGAADALAAEKEAGPVRGPAS